jgi:hypothetical protein
MQWSSQLEWGEEMKVTLFGVLAFVGIVALVIYVGNELQRANQAKAAQPPQNPDSSTNP